MGGRIWETDDTSRGETDWELPDDGFGEKDVGVARGSRGEGRFGESYSSGDGESDDTDKW